MIHIIILLLYKFHLLIINVINFLLIFIILLYFHDIMKKRIKIMNQLIDFNIIRYLDI